MKEWKKPQVKSLGVDNTETENVTEYCLKPDHSSHKPGECPLS